jgi:hypothetical protein
MSNVHVLAGKYSPLGYQQLNTVSSAIGFTVPEGARLALVIAEDQAVRWRDDGTDPTSTVGMKIIDGGQLSYSGDLSKIKFIEIVSGAELNVTYFG